MAKFYVTYKDPDGPDCCVSEAKDKIPAGEVERVCDMFSIGEYVTLELDTVAMTCTLVPEKSVYKRKVRSDHYYEKLTKEWQREKDEKEAEIRKWEELAKADDSHVAPIVRSFKDVEHPTLDGSSWETITPVSGTFKGETVQRIPIRMIKGSN